MAKRVDNDSTMEVSSSQLVPDGKSRPAPHRAPGQDKNDVSMWIGNVVGADAFAGTAKPKKSRGLLVLVVVLIVLAGGAAAYVLFAGKKDSAPSPSAGSTPAGSAAALPAAPVADAQLVLVPTATPDAAPADASVDAAPEGALKADAISGLPEKPAGAKKPTAKPTTKKPTTKKVVKKPAPKKTSHH